LHGQKSRISGVEIAEIVEIVCWFRDTGRYGSLKSPLCSCSSITLPDSSLSALAVIRDGFEQLNYAAEPCNDDQWRNDEHHGDDTADCYEQQAEKLAEELGFDLGNHFVTVQQVN
jgi:hypothetical protein